MEGSLWSTETLSIVPDEGQDQSSSPVASSLSSFSLISSLPASSPPPLSSSLSQERKQNLKEVKWLGQRRAPRWRSQAGSECPIWTRNVSVLHSPLAWLWLLWSSCFERIYPFPRDSFVWLTMKQKAVGKALGPGIQVLLFIQSLHWLALSVTLGNSISHEAQFLHLANEGVRALASVIFRMLQ